MVVGHATDDVHVGRRRPGDDADDARVLGTVIAGLILGVRWLAGQGRGQGRDEALKILRQRYARGEIDKQEFETRKRDLGR
jgi:uncharacterized membrane protein